MLRELLFGNENPIIRTLRQAIFVGVSGALGEGIKTLPGVDVTQSTTEFIIVGALIAVLTGADKAFRNWREKNSV